MRTRERAAVILDRHPVWLDAMDQLVAGVGIQVAGRATDVDEALALIEEHRPDMFIAGIDASTDHVSCVRRAKQAQPDLKAIVVSDDADTGAIEAAFAAGAAIYCVKTAEQEDLASAIRQVFERSIYIANGNGYEPAPRPSIEAESVAHELTRRELEILRLVAEGHSNSQLARMLWVTEQTVQLNGLLPARREEDVEAEIAVA